LRVTTKYLAVWISPSDVLSRGNTENSRRYL
jgi:hypothetical protein